MEPIVKHLLLNRELSVPEEDEVPLEEYWKKMRHLRGQVNEESLADHEIAVTWSAVPEQGA